MGKNGQNLIDELSDGKTLSDNELMFIIKDWSEELIELWYCDTKITCEMTFKLIEKVKQFEGKNQHYTHLNIIAMKTKHEIVLNYLMLNENSNVREHLTINVHCNKEINEILTNDPSRYVRNEAIRAAVSMREDIT